MARAGGTEKRPAAAVETLTRKGGRTRARLLAAAKKVFERDGYFDSRIVDICKAANVAPGTFYHYFDSKELLFRELAQAQEERLTAPEELGSEVPTERLSPIERIREANRRYLERYRAEAALMGVIEQASRYDAHVNAARTATMKHFGERAERSIRRMQEEGLVDSRIDPATAADSLGSMVARTSEMYFVQGYREYDFEELVEQLTLLWANALGLEESPAGGPPTGRRRRRLRANA